MSKNTEEIKQTVAWMAWGPVFFWTWPWTHAIVRLRFLPPPEFWSQVGFRGGSDGKESERETWVRSLGWKYPLEKRPATHSIILA